jgi:Putative Actinobacterial Holin-X, holin superfamily III
MTRERPITDIVKDILRSVQEIVGAEVRLAKVELKDEARQAARSGAWIAGGAAAAFMSLGFLLWSVAYGLSWVMPLWGATLAVGLTLSGLAWGLIATGLRLAKQVTPVPERTADTIRESLDTIKESLEWKASTK